MSDPRSYPTVPSTRSPSDSETAKDVEDNGLITSIKSHGSIAKPASISNGIHIENAEPIESQKLSASNFVLDSASERRLLWKFDLRLLPTLAIMYLFNALDKGNLGNAKTAGLEKTLNLTGNQYNILLSVFFVPYVLTAPFLGMLGKKYGPSRVLPIMMMTFGFMTLMTVAVKNFAGLMVLRWFLGMAESAFFPLVVYYQTTFYRRGELARRLAIFYAASNIANAFSGLLAFAVFRIENTSLANWRYLFIIEGGATMLFAVFAYWYLPFSAAKAKFLTEDEKKLAFYRIQMDSSSIVNAEFKFKEAIQIFKHPTSWVILAIEICIGVPIQSVALFLPVIVQALGYSTVKTNLYTVAPNITGAVMLLILAFASDHTRLRFPFIALGFIFTMIGFVIFACVELNNPAAYFACFMMTWGTSAPSVILDTWFNNNIADENRRVLLTSVGVPMANVMGLVSSNVFRSRDAPRYVPALATTAAFGATGCILTLGLGVYMILDNRRRDRCEGVKKRAKDIPTEFMANGPVDIGYRWFL